MTTGCVVATKSGWLIAAELVAESEKSWFVKYKDEPNHPGYKIYKSNKTKQVFKNCEDAVDWMEK